MRQLQGSDKVEPSSYHPAQVQGEIFRNRLQTHDQWIMVAGWVSSAWLVLLCCSNENNITLKSYPSVEPTAVGLKAFKRYSKNNDYAERS